MVSFAHDLQVCSLALCALSPSGLCEILESNDRAIAALRLERFDVAGFSRDGVVTYRQHNIASSRKVRVWFVFVVCFQWPSDRPGLNSQYLKDACVHICECFFLQLSRVHDLRGVFLGRKSSIPFSTVFSRTTLARNTRDCFLTGLRPRRVPTFQLPNLAATATFAGRDYRRMNEVVSYRLHCVNQDVGACMPCTLIELVTHSDRSRI